MNYEKKRFEYLNLMQYHVNKLILLMTVLICLICGYSEAMITKGSYAVTATEYQERCLYNYKKQYAIKKINYNLNDEHYVATLCHRWCLMEPDCVSFVINYGHICYLLDTSICDGKDIIFGECANNVHYDVFPGSDHNQNNCLQKCFAANPGKCELCSQRYNCVGDKCEDCDSYCWDFNPLLENKTETVIIKLKNIYNIFCDGLWQLIWKSGGSFNYPSFLNSFTLTVKVVLTLSNADTKVAYYDGIRYSHSLLDIGPYHETWSTIEDGWAAPFQSRYFCFLDYESESLNETINYMPFFYYANGNETTCYPIFSNLDGSHYFWDSDDLEAEDLKVIEIAIFVTEDYWNTDYNLLN